MANYAYLRVSTQQQILERQEELMRSKGVPEENWYREKISGGRQTKSRPVFDEMLQEMCPGDTLYVESMSRLGRNLEDLITTANYLTKERKIHLWLLKEGMYLSADEKSNPMQTMMFSVFGAFAQFQKDIQNELIRESLAAKKAKGIQLGAPKNEKKRASIRAAVTDPRWHGVVIRTAQELRVNPRTVKSVLAEI